MNNYGYLAENAELGLLQYTHDDDVDMHRCWQDIDTQKGYNGAYYESLESYAAGINIERFKFWVTVVDKATGSKVGSLRLGLDEECPDLAIWIYPEYRNMGYGLKSFRLALGCVFETCGLNEVYAGCFEDNKYSLAILQKLGFERHPEGDDVEQHFLTGKNTTMFDYRISKERFWQLNPQR